MEPYAGCERKAGTVGIPVVKHSMNLPKVCIISCISSYGNKQQAAEKPNKRRGRTTKVPNLRFTLNKGLTQDGLICAE